MKAYIIYINHPLSIDLSKKCAESCEKYNIEYEFFEGVYKKTVEELERIVGLKVHSSMNEKVDLSLYNATASHINLWKKIINEKEPALILEHDVIIKHHLNDLKIKDNVLLHLGPKVRFSSDYEFPQGFDTTYYPVRRWEGAHAYIMTPTIASHILNKLNYFKQWSPIESLVSAYNVTDIKMEAIDPARAVAVQSPDGVSFTESGNDFNFKYFPGFKAGVSPHATLFEENDYEFSVDWFTGNIPSLIELFEKLKITKNQRHRILEIGSYEGRSTTWFIDNMLENPSSEIFCIDTFKGSIEHTDNEEDWLFDRFTKNIGVSKWPSKIKLFKDYSVKIFPFFLKHKINFDIIYVDGSHEIHDVFVDAIISYILLSDNGVIIFDDYRWTMDGKTYPVKEAVDLFENIYPVECVMSNYQKAFVKKTKNS